MGKHISFLLTAALLLMIQGVFASASNNHDDDNAESFISQGMEAPAVQRSSSVSATSSTSTDLVTSGKVWPPKWSPFEHQEGWGKLHRLLIDEIFQWLLCTGDINNLKNAAFVCRNWHRYTQSMEFKNLFMNAIQEQVGDDSSDAPGHPARLFKAHRKYFQTYENRKLIEFFQNKTFAGALEITSPWGQQYRTDYAKTRRVAHNPRKTSLSLDKPYNGNYDLEKSLRLAPTVHFDLGKLTCLNLKGNKLKILPDLPRMTNLQALNLESNDLMELPHLGTLTNLKALLLATNFFTEIPGLSALSQLKVLDVSDTPLAHLEGLENLSELREIRACWDYTNYANRSPCRTKPERNAFTNLSALEHLTNLRKIDFHGFRINGFPNITKLTNLDELYLENLGISDVPGLEHMTQLIVLSLSNSSNYQSETMNIFTSLPNLSKLKRLEFLRCNNVGLSQCHSLELLTNLEDLELAGNKLTSFNELEKLQKLDDLLLTGNPLDILPDLRNLQRLERIMIEGTPLTALHGLGIWCSDNHAEAPAIMSAVDRLTQLQVLRNMPVAFIGFAQ